jgi:predicted ATPase
VEEFARFAASQGAVILAGRCFEFGENVAYQSIVEALRSAPDRAAALAPLWFAELSRLLPELNESQPALPQPPPASDETARQRLFEAVLRWLDALTGGRRPVIVFLDDLHWADAASLDLLHYLVRNAIGRSALFVGTHRPEETPGDHPLTHLRRGLSRDRLVQSLPLKPLTPEAMQTIADGLIEGGAAQELARYLQRESEGNPFVMTEALNALYESGALLPAAEGKWRLTADRPAPEAALTASLRDTILRRVERLTEPARRALQLASVIGRNFDAALLRAAIGAEAEPIWRWRFWGWGKRTRRGRSQARRRRPWRRA